jgi:HEAT repeat protein
MKTVKLIFTVATLVGAVAYACALEGASTPAASSMDLRFSSMTVHEIVSSLRTGPDSKDKRKVAGYLAIKNPKSKDEVKELFNFIAETDKENDGANSLSRFAVDALVKVTDVSLIPEFSKRLKKGSLNERRAAILVAAKFKLKDAVPDLIDIAGEDVDNIAKSNSEFNKAYLQLTAYSALGIIGDGRAIPVMLKKLGKMEGHEIQVIAKFGNMVAPQLIEIAQNSKDKQEKDAARLSISEIADIASVPLLWQTLQRTINLNLREACINSLLLSATGATNPTKSEVLKYLYTEAPLNRRFMYSTLFIAKNNGDVEYLINALKNPQNDSGIRNEAIMLLGELKAQSSVSALEDALKDPSEEVRFNATAALEKITGKRYGKVDK